MSLKRGEPELLVMQCGYCGNCLLGDEEAEDTIWCCPLVDCDARFPRCGLHLETGRRAAMAHLRNRHPGAERLVEYERPLAEARSFGNLDQPTSRARRRVP